MKFKPIVLLQEAGLLVQHGINSELHGTLPVPPQPSNLPEKPRWGSRVERSLSRSILGLAGEQGLCWKWRVGRGHCMSRGGNLVGFGPSAFVDVFVVIVVQT